MVNKAILVGRLGGDPENKTTGNGNTVCTFSLATSESWVDREGQKQEKTEWHRIVVWGQMAVACGNHLSKGSQVYVEGPLQTRSWENQQGVKQYSTEVVAKKVQFLGSKGGSNNQQSGGGYAPEPDFEPSFESNEEIPF